MTTSRPSRRVLAAPRTFAAVLTLALALFGADATRSAAPLAAAPAAVAASAVAGATASGSSFTFTGSGWGHGVGMSQYGAQGLAKAGRSHTQILQTYYSGAAVQSRSLSDDLRVLIASGRPTLTLVATGHTTINGVGNLAAGAKVTLQRSGGSIKLTGALDKTVAGPLTVRYFGNPLTVTPGNSYRYGQLSVSIDPAGGLRAVVTGLTMQQYLYGLAEMPASWHAQALRAQAVAARTFAQKRRDSRAGKLDYDLLSTTQDQVYAGTKNEHPQWVSAVDVTADQVVTHGGDLIDAVYFSTSGGHTESGDYVWSSNPGYLTGVPDPFEANANSPHASWSRTYTGAQLGAWFKLGTVSSVQILGTLGVSQRVDRATIRLTGTGGTVEVTGTKFRSTVNQQIGVPQLMSTRFAVVGSGSPISSGPPSGTWHTAYSSGRTVIVGGTATDPDGAPKVKVVSTMGTVVATRIRDTVNGSFLVTWNGAPGTRRVCVSVIDVPSGAETSLGCRDVVVK